MAADVGVGQKEIGPRAIHSPRAIFPIWPRNKKPFVQTIDPENIRDIFISGPRRASCFWGRLPLGDGPYPISMSVYWVECPAVAGGRRFAERRNL